MPTRLAPLDFQTPAINDKVFTFTDRWRELLRLVIGDVATISSLPAVINRWVLADQPSLVAGDAGYLAFVSDYGHLVRWTGTVWEFAPGDCGNRFLRDFVQPPQEVGWALCDGGATTFLVVGAATLTTAAFTTPNLSGSPAYKKSAAAYTGTINAASGVTGTGVTGTGVTGTGVTGTDVTGTGVTGTGTSGGTAPGTSFASNTTLVDAGAGPGAWVGSHSHLVDSHTHTVPALTVPALTVPALTVPALTVPALTVPALAVGTIDMPNLAVLPYVRR